MCRDCHAQNAASQPVSSASKGSGGELAQCYRSPCLTARELFEFLEQFTSGLVVEPRLACPIVSVVEPARPRCHPDLVCRGLLVDDDLRAVLEFEGQDLGYRLEIHVRATRLYRLLDLSQCSRRLLLEFGISHPVVLKGPLVCPMPRVVRFPFPHREPLIARVRQQVQLYYPWYVPKKILVIGGYGRIGGGLLRRLQGEPGIECVLGGRDAGHGAREAAGLGIDFVPVDVTRAASVNAALDGVFAAVHAAGPFQWRDYGVASACVRRRVHYVDVANTRSFILGISTLDDRARGNGVCALSGAGMIPALSGALAAELASAFDRIDVIDISLCTGVAGGPAAVRALFADAGRPIRRLEAGRWQEVRIGAAAAEVMFSPPFGRRRLFCQDAADLELFPKRFGATTVRYQASYAPGLMRAVQMISWLRRWGLLAEPERFAASVGQPLRAATPGMGLRLCVQGERHDAPVRREIELLAPSDDTLLPCAPVLALLRRWQRGETVAPGARPCMDVPSFADIKSVLVGSGVLLSIV